MSGGPNLAQWITLASLGAVVLALLAIAAMRAADIAWYRRRSPDHQVRKDRLRRAKLIKLFGEP